MEFKTTKAKKKSNLAKLISWGRMFRTPLLILFLLGTTNCHNDSDIDVSEHHLRHMHNHIQPNLKNKLSDLKYLRRNLNKNVNFVMTDYLVDGETENRVHFNGVTAKETFIGGNSKGLKLRQLTDGRHFVQIIYAQNGKIQSCEHITKFTSIKKFLKRVRKELKTALDDELLRIRQKNIKYTKDDKYLRSFRNVSLYLLRNGEGLPNRIASWLDYNKLKFQCNKRHAELKNIMEHWNETSDDFFRPSRSPFVMTLPGTKWCGPGDLAVDRNDLGLQTEADLCCREHDLCPKNIKRFSYRYTLFNSYPYTVSHCECDLRFRHCLKMADTAVSNFVGNLYFNVLSIKCFILKEGEVCLKRNYWGRCQQWGYSKQAYLRENLRY